MTICILSSPSGHEKTTLLGIIEGFENPTEGTIKMMEN